MTNLDYIAIIDELNDQAFQRSVELLFPLLGYRILTKDDVRKVDLKERVLELIARYVPSKGRKSVGTLDKYGEILKFYFEYYLPCKLDSIASRYRTIALETIKTIKPGIEEIRIAEDLFMIFLSMMRSAKPDFEKKTPIENISFIVKNSDGELLEEIKDHEFLWPVAQIAASFVQTPIAKKVIKPNLQPVNDKEFAYLNNVLLYCRMMQAQGEFSEGDDSNVESD